ncbi:ANTAR domain-containing protein [Amycolatopsis vastitatis]|uniref:ANTAR domain-containing protein n=1 Tax=Amycolatopsis vastitatis TaxID=1905142 RepID=A0A229SQ21_9PSEU|nr:ANTAR domain-containing protein [Amycolatopsis vastitatis]OXM60870.1 ANTAR domain-containing protein [Amycolatopsis vastitatis]
MEHDRGRRFAGGADPAAENEQLRAALSSQPVIEQAKGMVMLLRGCTAAEAFHALVVVSQRSNVKLRDVATVVVAAGSEAEPGLADEETERAVRAALGVHLPG